MNKKSFYFILAVILFLTFQSFNVSADSSTFTDIAEDNVHKEAIQNLTGESIIQGYTDNTFRPWQSLECQQAAVILYRAGNFKKPDNISSILKKYKDVPSNHPYAEEIAAVTEAGIFSGNDNDQFHPRNNITREQMATVLVRAFKLDKESEKEIQINLDNVDPSHQKNVQILANKKLTTATRDFRPADDISRAATTTLIYKALHIGDYTLSIMHFNDYHAHAEQLPKMVTAVEKVRSKKPDALLLNAGDVFSGTLYFNEFSGEADIALMNLLGINAMAFGNHEFDLGGQEEGHAALKKFVETANFPFVAANVDFSNDALFDELTKLYTSNEAADSGKIYPQIVKEVNGEKIGIFGLTTEGTVDSSSPEKVTFSDYKKSAEEAVENFEEAGINKIIAVTHIGFDSDPSVGNDLLLAEVDGIDVIVGGHSHTELPEPVIVDKDSDGNEKDPTVIVQAFQYANFLGSLDVVFDKNGVVTDYEGELLDLNEKDENDNPIYPADENALMTLAPYKEKVDEKMLDETAATALIDLENPRQRADGGGYSVRANETALGNLITDGMLEEAKQYNDNTVIAFQNGGGIRTDIEKGPITTGEIMEVLPFGNTLDLVEMTAEEIKEVLEHSVSLTPNENGGFMHVSGMKFTYDSTKEPGDRILDMQLKDGDGYVEFDENATYIIVTHAFITKGGDGYDTFANLYEKGKVYNLGLSDWGNLKKHMENIGEIQPEIEDRIVDVSQK